MGIADMNFRVAPCVTNALNQRVQHENWGYLDTPRSLIDALVHWNRQRYGVKITPGSIFLTTGVHLLPEDVLSSRQQGPAGDAQLRRLRWRHLLLRMPGGGIRDEAAERQVLHGSSGSGAPHRSRYQYSDSVQSSQSHGQLMVP